MALGSVASDGQGEGMAGSGFCESCGASLHEGAQFCGKCGHVVAGAEAATTEGTAAPTSAAPPSAPVAPVTAASGGTPKWVWPAALGAAALVIVALIVLLVAGGGEDKGGEAAKPAEDEVLLEPINAAVPDPFTERVTTGSETTVQTASLPNGVPARAGTGGQVNGSAPGLFGGSGNAQVCDRDRLVQFLEANPDKARAWAGVLGIAPSQIRTYVAKLTPILLTGDTLVLNHGFANGRATPRNAVLQAGTAVLVDEYGIPRVKCNCGNPLAQPTLTKAAKVRGTRWPGFQSQSVLKVVPATVVNIFVVVNINTGELTNRPPGTDGTRDSPVLIDQLCDLFPDDPACTAPTETLPPATAAPTAPEPSGTTVNTPEDAIGQALTAAGYSYLGDCSLADNSATDLTGMWCSLLFEDHGSYRVYGIGPIASETNDTINVALEGNTWVVVD